MGGMAARMGSIALKRTPTTEPGRSSARAATAPPGTKRLVWRISAASPLGEWVDPSIVPAVPAGKAEPAEVTTGGFLSSSFDLLRGTDVQELPGDTVPADLFDEYFPQHAAWDKGKS